MNRYLKTDDSKKLHLDDAARSVQIKIFWQLKP
jgi:hypothetical protein